MKNIQVIDGAMNCAYDVFGATDDEFAAIFRDDTDIEFIDDFLARVSRDEAERVLVPLWKRRVDKKSIVGIHGTLFYQLDFKREFYPNKKDSDIYRP